MSKQYVIQGYFCNLYGWEDVCVESTKEDARDTLYWYMSNDDPMKYRIKYYPHLTPKKKRLNILQNISSDLRGFDLSND